MMVRKPEAAVVSKSISIAAPKVITASIDDMTVSIRVIVRKACTNSARPANARITPMILMTVPPAATGENRASTPSATSTDPVSIMALPFGKGSSEITSEFSYCCMYGLIKL
jgi:hypothetical protein